MKSILWTEILLLGFIQRLFSILVISPTGLERPKFVNKPFPILEPVLNNILVFLVEADLKPVLGNF